MKNSTLKNIKGSTLQDRSAHDQHHLKWSRRNFMSTLGISGGMGMMLGQMPVQASQMTPLGAGLLNADSDRSLVLIQLNGGNDGLNTLVPLYDYDYYRNLRPRIAFDQSNLINLNDDFALPITMQDLIPLWEEGAMKAIHNVGYPNPNLSHFRGSDIWSTASNADELPNSGWMGRWLDHEYPDFANEPPRIPPAIQIGSYGSLIFNNGMFNLSVSVSNPGELADIAENGELYDANAVPDTCYGNELSFVRTVSNTTFVFAEAIKEAFDASSSQAEYENLYHDLADQLQIVARLIKGNLGSKIYMVSISGFDTHADQNQSHPSIWQGISSAVKAFYEDLGAADKANDVLTMTFSEFGRRIEENASAGTDHGTAAPMFMFGPGLADNGFIGTRSDLQNPDEFGNLQFSTDFRSVYATVLEQWLCVDGALVNQVMGQAFDRINGLVTPCGLATSIDDALTEQRAVFHKALYNDNGDILIQYQLAHGATVSLDILSVQGTMVTNLANGSRPAGQYSSLFSPGRHSITSGIYLYRLIVDGQPFSQTIRVVN